MDPSKSKSVSSSQKSRGRGNRGRVRPQAQPPNYPQYPQSGYYAQPPPPTPPMHQQYHQSGYYPQHPPPPLPPMNPTQYNISMTSEFNPFMDYREGPSRREPSVERELPIYDEDDDDVEVVPETQPQTQIDDDAQVVKEKTKADKKAWTSIEEVALAKTWIHISTCKKVGNEQGRDRFWERILEHFKSTIQGSKRTRHSLNTKWKNMNQAMGVFNGLYIQQTRIRESGCDDVNVMHNAMSDYDKKNKGSSFTHIEAWKVVKEEPKWLQQPCFEKVSSTSHSDKRRKSSESSYYESGSNDNVETVIPDLNDDTTPVSKRKGKKTASESSSKNSVAEFIENYTAKKSLALDEAMEEKREKDALSKKLMAAQLENANEKAMIRAYKFYNEPHDHITNPVMREFAIAKKRAYAEKYGWPMDF